MKTRVIVAAVIQKGNAFLFGRKEKNIGPYPNTWHLIGGGVHLEEETLEQAIKREVKEEAGITIKNIKQFSFDEGDEPNKHGELTHYIFLVFLTDYHSGKETPGDDIKELHWFSQEEIKKISLPIPTQKVFSLLKLL